MHPTDAAALIAPAVAPAGGGGAAWADLGAGEGTFTRALSELLGTGGRVYAVDRDRRAVAALERVARGAAGAAVVALAGDFADPAAARRLALPPLDGVLMANALHFVPAAEQAAVLARVASWLRPGGRLVVVEYDDRPASRWVPHPVPLARLGAIVPAGVTAPVRVGTRRSAFGGTMYAAASTRAPAGG